MALEKPQRPKNARGISQSALRLYNERLVLSLVRRHGSLSKVELAKLTNLSAQTISVIVRALEQNGLLVAGEPQRGRVGQPMVPFSLQPDGAFSIGLKVGRRSGELMLIDLAGKIRGRVWQAYHFPSPAQFMSFAKKSMEKLLRSLSPQQQQRISGLGVAAPFDLWNWGEAISANPKHLAAWRDFDLKTELGKAFGYPVIPCNDATAACAAELLFGERGHAADFAYFYIGYFVGGGLVLNGTLMQGRTGNAAALGSMLIPGGNKSSQQLITAASLYTLESALKAKDQDTSFMWKNAGTWHEGEPHISEWINIAATGLAQAIVSVAAITECSEVVIDGAIPEGIRESLVAATSLELAKLNQSGLTSFTLTQGELGNDARALGAASLPLFANFIIDRDLLFKEAY